jgi:hypothetical protein
MNKDGEQKLEDFGARRAASLNNNIDVLMKELERSEVQKRMLIEALEEHEIDVELDGVPYWTAVQKHRLEKQFIENGVKFYRNLMGGTQEAGDFMASAYELLLFHQEQEREAKNAANMPIP